MTEQNKLDGLHNPVGIVGLDDDGDKCIKGLNHKLSVGDYVYAAPPQAKLHAQFQAGVDSMIESAEYQKAAAFQLGREEGLTQLQAAIDKARKECEDICDDVGDEWIKAWLKLSSPRATAEEIKRRISALIGKSLRDSNI